MGEFMRRFMLAAIAAVSLVAPAPAQVLPSADIDALLAALPGVVATYETKSDIGGVIALDGLKIAMKNPDGTPVVDGFGDRSRPAFPSISFAAGVSRS